MHEHGLLLDAFVFLLGAVLAVPLSRRLRLGAVLGYLMAGAAIGPWGIGFVSDPRAILGFAELGVVLLLFLIGLELNPRRLWSLRGPIFGLGGAQVALTTAVVMGAGLLLGASPAVALVAGMGLSMSSTAMALQLLAERNLLPTPAGHHGFAVLLFQDLAVIPMLALVALLAGRATAPGEAWLDLARMLGVIVVIVAGGRYALRPLFRLVADARSREVFTAFSLLLVIGAALLMQAVGLSMALGTFLAGVLLANSEYRHALESDIEPFKGLLLGLFFIAVGMSVDIGVLLARPLLVLGLVAGLVVVKALVLLALARVARLPAGQGAMFALPLSAGGEFAFVLFGAAAAEGILASDVRDLLVVTVALSMLSTPVLLALTERRAAARAAAPAGAAAEAMHDQGNPVLIAGFGRFGQIVGRFLNANGIGTTVLDHDPDHIEMVRRFGFQVFYGDATRLDLLRAAGAERARLLVIAVDDREQALKVVETVREALPNLVLLARAWDMVHAFELLERGVRDFERETFEGALRLGEEALRRLGATAWQAKQAAHRFRRHDEDLLLELYRHFRQDLEVRAAVSASARERLRQVMKADEERLGVQRDADWH
jgi:glutathione-regulated potassium-efflux system ancillary protein KefC